MNHQHPLTHRQPQKKDFIYVRKYPQKSDEYSIVKTIPNGNCFYESLSLAHFEGKKNPQEVRNEMATFLSTHLRDFADFFVDDELTQTVMKIRKNGEYARYEYLAIAANFIQRPIMLYRGVFTNSPSKEIFKPTSLGSLQANLDNSVKLIFTGKLDSGHFDAIIRSNTVNRSKSITFAPVSTQKPSVQQEPITTRGTPCNSKSKSKLQTEDTVCK